MDRNLIKYKFGIAILKGMLRDKLITTQEYNACDIDLKSKYQI
jgi:hypothetical protein